MSHFSNIASELIQGHHNTFLSNSQGESETLIDYIARTNRILNFIAGEIPWECKLNIYFIYMSSSAYDFMCQYSFGSYMQIIRAAYVWDCITFRHFVPNIIIN